MPRTRIGLPLGMFLHKAFLVVHLSSSKALRTFTSTGGKTAGWISNSFTDFRRTVGGLTLTLASHWYCPWGAICVLCERGSSPERKRPQTCGAATFLSNKGRRR